MNVDDRNRALSDESKRIEEDATYSSKGHFEDAQKWSTVHLWLGIPTAIIAGISGVFAFNEETLLAGALAIIAGMLASLSTFLNPSEKASTHHNAGVMFNSLRNKARIFREIDLKKDVPYDVQSERIKELASRKDELNESSPQISRNAFERTRKGIEEGEASYSADN